MPSRFFTDQTHFQLQVHVPAKRIVSLVPSQTELLFDLGLNEQVVGITRYCVHPTHWKENKTIVGGTKNFQLEVIDEIDPDLIIANKEENHQEGILQLRKKYPVWTSDIASLTDAEKMIGEIGELTATEERAREIINTIQSAFRTLRKKPARKVLYLIWRKPWMAAGEGTFIHTMLEKTGWVNGMTSQSRYPVLSDDDIRTIQPELILLSSEPYPFREKHRAELNKLVPDADIMLVDGEMFSWYGSRLQYAPAYLNQLPAE
jgi:ABC-type Fe3+-hydroxamate transport system substrate-binding protein